MENNLIQYKINEGDIIKIGRITIRITEIKNDNNNDDYYLNKNKGGINISQKSINIINSSNSNNNSRIINEIVEITNLKKFCNNSTKNLEFFRTGTNQAITAITTKHNFEDKNISENKNDINIINENSENEKGSNYNEINNEDYKIKKKNSKNKICRICYMEEDDPENNPLLNPCICSGSMKYIHFQCLRHWINNKCYSKINNNSNCYIFKIKPVECELCKTKFPDLIIKNDIKYNISEFKPEYDNYLIFESLTLDKNKNKYIYIVSLNNNEENKIYIGRDKDSTVLLSDISVSRIHCKLNIDNDNLYINDEESAFGTLLLMQTESINLIEDLPLYIQIGRTFFKILPKKNKSNFFCCDTSERPNNKFYFNQNEKNIFYHKKITMLKLNDKENVDDLKEIDENKKENESNINIKKIIIKKNKLNNSSIENKNNIKSYLANYENTEKLNAINDYSVNSKSLRKMELNNDLIDKDNSKNENSIKINANDKNTILNQENKNLKKKDLIDNDINENSKNSNTQSIYLDEEN